MKSTIPRTSFVRASAMGTSTILPRRTALQMWALSGGKNAWKDLVSIVTNEQDRSGFRVLAASILIKKDAAKTCSILSNLLQQETHPRMTLVAIELLGLYGERKAYQQLEYLFLNRQLPGSCRKAMLTSLRLLRHRWGLNTGIQLDSQSAPAQASHWLHKAFPIGPATGKSFQSALKTVKKRLPSISIDQGFAAVFPCGDKKMSLLLTPEFNQISSVSPLWNRPGLIGVILEQTEDGHQQFGWVFSSPACGLATQIDVYHVDGRQLYTGKGEMVEDAFHYTITTVAGAGLPVMLISGGFRKNQILNDGILRISSSESLPRPVQNIYAQSA